MATIKIHYLGFGVQTLHDGATIEDAVFHLGSKYGASIYNEARKRKLITFHKNIILVRPFDIKEIKDEYTTQYSIV